MQMGGFDCLTLQALDFAYMASMNKTMKLLHVIGSIGFCAGLLALLSLHASLPNPAQGREFAVLRETMGSVAVWLLLPSTALVVVSGLLAMAFSDYFKNAGWVWIKLATGVLVMEGTLVYVLAPMQKAAANAQTVLDDTFNPAELDQVLSAEWGSFWVILGLALVNILLGIYRPRLSRKIQK
jgi:uncharacterized membrane protein